MTTTWLAWWCGWMWLSCFTPAVSMATFPHKGNPGPLTKPPQGAEDKPYFVIYGKALRSTEVPGSTEMETKVRIQEVILNHSYLKGKSEITLKWSSCGTRRDIQTETPLVYAVFADKEERGHFLFCTRADQDSCLKYMQKRVDMASAPIDQQLIWQFEYIGHSADELAADAMFEYRHMADLKRFAQIRHAFDAVKLRKWLEHAATADTVFQLRRIELYATLLGFCGTKEDGIWLQRLCADPKLEMALPGLLTGCCLLAPEEGLKQLDAQINPPQRHFGRSHTALTVAEDLLQNAPLVPRKPILEAMKKALKDPDLAMRVLTIARRVKEWTFLEEAKALYDKPGDKDSHLICAMIRFAIDCPGPQAKQFLQRLKEDHPLQFQQAEKDLSFEKSLGAPGK
jgi:hypothetical protein